ncbi:MAG: hypothetical protein RLZZ573_2272, partial [Pseudomonadota bacterium]
YYDWLERAPSARTRANVILLQSIRRAHQISDETYGMPRIRTELSDTGITARRHDKVVLITVRELGPIIKIGASLAMVEGGTEVVLGVSEFMHSKTDPRTFTVQWRSGGPGVLKGVATLVQDMQAALAAGLQPAVR